MQDHNPDGRFGRLAAIEADLAPETYRWQEIVAEANNDALPAWLACRLTVIESIAHRGGLSELAAERVVDHAIHLQLLAERCEGHIVYVPENPGRELGDDHE